VGLAWAVSEVYKTTGGGGEVSGWGLPPLVVLNTENYRKQTSSFGLFSVFSTAPCPSPEK